MSVKLFLSIYSDQSLKFSISASRSKAKKLIDISVGESVRIIRELQELSLDDLAKLTGIPPSTISEIGKDKISLDVEIAKILTRALRCHPAVLVIPGWEMECKSAVYTIPTLVL